MLLVIHYCFLHYCSVNRGCRRLPACFYSPKT